MSGVKKAYIGVILGIGSFEIFPQNIDRRLGLDGNAGEHAVIVNITD